MSRMRLRKLRLDSSSCVSRVNCSLTDAPLRDPDHVSRLSLGQAGVTRTASVTPRAIKESLRRRSSSSVPRPAVDRRRPGPPPGIGSLLCGETRHLPVGALASNSSRYNARISRGNPPTRGTRRGLLSLQEVLIDLLDPRTRRIAGTPGTPGRPRTDRRQDRGHGPRTPAGGPARCRCDNCSRDTRRSIAIRSRTGLLWAAAVNTGFRCT